jgi:hypothetical protein
MKQKIIAALGLVVGLGIYYLLGCALNSESLLMNQIIGIGLGLWLGIAFVGSTLLILAWLVKILGASRSFSEWE